MKTELKEEWKTYYNPRFNYSIKYPSSWLDQPPAPNNDGKALYKDKENEILIYGTYEPSIFSTQDIEVNRHIVVLDNGAVATGMRFYNESRKVEYLVFVTKEDVQFVFSATVTREFYQKNAKVLEKVAKSLEF